MKLSRRSTLGLAGTAFAAGALSPLAATPARADSSAGVPDTAVLREWIDEQVDFIASQQLSSGAVLAPDEVTITPYFVSWGLMALARVNNTTSHTVIGNYLEWYLAHRNTADEDPYGFAGTVFVHSYDPATGTENSTDRYSSVDAGVASPVMVARDAWATGNPDLQSFVLDNLDAWEEMIEHDLTLSPDGVAQADGLCEVRPGGVIYQQDNAVVHAGLLAMADLEDALDRTAEATRYRQAAAAIKTALRAKLWNEDKQNWHWALTNDGRPSASDPAEVFYPDAWCQYWPVYLDLFTPTSVPGVRAWQAFKAGCPNWMLLETGNDFPHTEMGLTAVKMGDTEDAATLLQTIHDKYSPLGWGDTWYVGESGHFIRTALALIETT